MRELKLYLAEFDPSIGKVSYSIEDENGDRVDKGNYTHENLKTYDPKTMDFFLLSYLPKLMSMGDNLEVLGPLSNNLINKLETIQLKLIREGIHPFGTVTVKISDVSQPNGRDYHENDVLDFAEKYLENNSIDDTLKAVFERYS